MSAQSHFRHQHSHMKFLSQTEDFYVAICLSYSKGLVTNKKTSMLPSAYLLIRKVWLQIWCFAPITLSGLMHCVKNDLFAPREQFVSTATFVLRTCVNAFLFTHRQTHIMLFVQRVCWVPRTKEKSRLSAYQHHCVNKLSFAGSHTTMLSVCLQKAIDSHKG